MGVRSSVPTRKDRQDSPGIRMEAIKKKMQAMKVEKDNLCDRCDEVEQKAKEAHIRQEKAEEECTELTNKARTLEIDVDKFGEKLAQQFKEAFGIMDADKDGLLSSSDLVAAFGAYGKNIGGGEAQAMLDEVD